MTQDEEQVIALIIINHGEHFSNTYWLCKVINRWFEIFDCTSVIKNIIANKYVTYTMSGGVEIFEITDLGSEFLKTNKARIIEMLLREFPKQEDILKAMANE